MTGFYCIDLFIPAVDCGMPPALLNAKVSDEETTLGQSITYECLPGFWFERNIVEENITCQANRLWTDISYELCRGKLSLQHPYMQISKVKFSYTKH